MAGRYIGGMQVLIVLAHPRPGSYNHAAAHRVAAALTRLGHRPLLHDLYAEGFDPVLTDGEIRRHFSFDERVLRHGAELAAAGGLVVVHPDWWGGPPALLKGWVDRVLASGVAYELEGAAFGPKRRVPLLAGKKGLALCTSDEPAGAGPGGGPLLLEALWVERIFRWCGLEQAACHVLRDLHRLEPAARSAWLDFAEREVERLFPPAGGGPTPPPAPSAAGPPPA